MNMMKDILKDLSQDQRRQEKALRRELYEELKNHRKTSRELGRRLLQLQDELVGKRKFKGYLECLGIPRRTAYRWMEIHKLLASLPETVLRAAEKKNMDLGSEKYRDAIKAVPCPENPTPAEANEWLNAIEAHHKESAAKPEESPDPSALATDQRNQLTSQACSKHCKQLGSFVATYWPDVPAEERSIEVAQIVMGVAAANLGITESFTVVPNDHPELVDRLEKKSAQEEEVEEEVAA